MATTAQLSVPASSAKPVVGDRELARVRRFAEIFDRYMVDPVLGFVLPGVGDIVSSAVGMYLVAIALRRRVSPIVIARMLLNLALDAALGFIPIIGDLIDVGFKANLKNVALLEDRHANQGRGTWRDWVAVLGALLAFLAVLGLVIYAMVSIGRFIARHA